MPNSSQQLPYLSPTFSNPKPNSSFHSQATTITLLAFGYFDACQALALTWRCKMGPGSQL